MEDQSSIKKVYPTGKRLAVEIEKPKTMTHGGIHKPQQAIDNERAELNKNLRKPLNVIAVGEESSFKVGDKVLIARAGFEIEYKDKLIHILDEYDVVAKVDVE